MIATILVTAGIVGANLLVPMGRVLFRLGPFRITELALLEGIEKAVTFEGLVYISKACILPTLRLPGRFGKVVAAAFVYYERILEKKGAVRPKSLIADVDELVLAVWEGEEPTRTLEARTSFPPIGYVVLAAAAALSIAAALAPASLLPR